MNAAFKKAFTGWNSLSDFSVDDTTGFQKRRGNPDPNLGNLLLRLCPSGRARAI
jgi:hypothetical protein